ncbi:MAG TPA: TraR/DksA C4-type zinc finger protein [Kiritimatiellia bacterium]|nr:TraR/DksA C4-type zinc finger protein [Kiritimatiellia bacterium]HQQ90788.1 TraR/DksA C4-type zinc finger protein [Kiritimatiellia bacterium]
MTVAKKSKPKATPKATPHRKPVAKKQATRKVSGSRPQKPLAAKKSAPVKAKAKAKPAPIAAAKRAAQSPSKRTQPHAKTATKPVPKAAVPIKKPVSKIVRTSSSIPPAAAAHKVPARAATTADSKKPRFHKGDLEQFKTELLSMRERITGQSGSMRHAALQRNDEINPEEDGTDAFMRLQTLEQVGSQHRDIANIDDALRSIEKGTYGICEMCGELISKPRLAVLPFATNCIKCQSEMERMSRRGGRR